MEAPKHERKDFIRDMIAEDLRTGKHAAPITRFPPEPNGYLHIGHAKSLCLNFGIAQEFAATGAKCHLRFDDTNPSKEDQEYVDSIQEDIRWLGFDWGGDLFYASDIFQYFYDCAVHLINQGLAYVDAQSPESVREQRGSTYIPGTHSPYRDRNVQDNLNLFAQMRAGGVPDGSMVLRAKIDMASSNMNMRDPILYRIMHAEHHNTGSDWCIYPMYDFAHPLEDAHEHITHSLCTLEFENHRPLYDWVINNCPVPARPQQTEFARLNLTYTVMSKRKLLQLVQEGHVTSWDDPRLPTLSGLRRRGYPSAAIRNFCYTVGITKFNSMTDVSLLEFGTRVYLNQHAPRRMAVLHPLLVTIRSLPADHEEEVSVLNNPEQPEAGTRHLPLTQQVWIEQDDFTLDPPKKYFRLAPGRTVRLRGGYCITAVDYRADEHGNITEVICEHIPGTIGANPPEGIQCRAAIHWVSTTHATQAQVRLYDRLFSVENPDAAEGGFLSVLNPNSLTLIQHAQVEPVLAIAEPETVYQFERIGYFVADRWDHTPGECPVFNRTVALKDSWAKTSHK